MKSIFKITGILTLCIFLMMSCASSQFNNEPPFKVSKATYKITHSLYEITIISDQPIISTPSTVYFRDRFSSNINVNGNQLNILISRVNTSDIIMHRDPEKEYGNIMHNNKNTRFKLADDEFVLSFGSKKNELLYKILVESNEFERGPF